MFDDFDDPHFGALEAGTAYALFRHGQDAQTRQLADAFARNPSGPTQIDVHVQVSDDEDDASAVPINALQFTTEDMPQSWDDYVGQEPMKLQLQIAIRSAQARGAALDHILLGSGMPGVGKTRMARLLAVVMDVDIIELVPPFNLHTLVAALEQLCDGDICFIDEIHLLMMKRRGGEMLLKILEDKVAYMPDGDVIELNDITIIGATTEKDLLPEPVLDRFKLKPYFQPYSHLELAKICIDFAIKHDVLDQLDNDLAHAIADACRNTPRIIEELVLAVRDLWFAYRRTPTAEEVLSFLEIEPDGLTRTHIHYLTAMRQYYRREAKDGAGYEYIAGESVMMSILRESKQGIGRIERFLTERGLIDRTPRGRKLTDRGIARAETFIAQGKGASDVA